jgi:hypothetical protein
MRRVSGDDPEQLLKRARDLANDLNLSTLGWRIPSETLIEDFAAHEHGLRAQEHELSHIDPRGSHRPPRRAFSLYEPQSEAGTAPLVALLLEPAEGGAWILLVPDRP